MDVKRKVRWAPPNDKQTDQRKMGISHGRKIAKQTSKSHQAMFYKPLFLHIPILHQREYVDTYSAIFLQIMQGTQDKIPNVSSNVKKYIREDSGKTSLKKVDKDADSK